MTLIPFPPRGELLTRLEFATVVLQTYEGEQRLSRRASPRLGVSMSFELFGDEIEEARTLGRRIAESAGVIALPDWRYARQIAVTAGQTTFDVGDVAALYEVGGAVIIWQAPRDFVSATVTAVNAPTVTVSAGPAVAMPSARVAPVWSGVSSDGLAISPEGYGFAIGTLNATLFGYPDLSATAVPLSYESEEFFDGLRIRGADLTDTVERAHTIVDNGQGPIEAVPDQNYTAGRLTLSLEEESTDAIFAREAFFHRRRGRAKPFFVSSDTNDFEPIGGVGGPDITIPDSITPAEITGLRLNLTQTDGTETPTTVLGAVDNLDGTLTATVSPNLPAASESEIATLSELALVRLDADAIEFRTSFDGVTRIGVPLWRVDYEL
ncbi:MAG: hypothetical protein AAGC81_02400 [Pseudomonadota bacterium]